MRSAGRMSPGGSAATSGMPPACAGSSRPGSTADVSYESAPGRLHDHLRPSDRTPEHEALGEVTPPCPQLRTDALVLDSFCRGLEPEVAGELDRRPHDHRVLAAVRHVGDERLVDLDLRHGQSLQVGERRIAGPEVVDGQPDAERAQFLQRRRGTPGLVDHRALGDLELKRRCTETPLAQQLPQRRRQAPVDEVARREIHRDAHVEADVAPGSAPGEAPRRGPTP